MKSSIKRFIAWRILKPIFPYLPAIIRSRIVYLMLNEEQRDLVIRYGPEAALVMLKRRNEKG